MDEQITTYQIGCATVHIHGGPLNPEALKPIFAKFMADVYREKARKADIEQETDQAG